MTGTRSATAAMLPSPAASDQLIMATQLHASNIIPVNPACLQPHQADTHASTGDLETKATENNTPTASTAAQRTTGYSGDKDDKSSFPVHHTSAYNSTNLNSLNLTTLQNSSTQSCLRSHWLQRCVCTPAVIRHTQLPRLYTSQPATTTCLLPHTNTHS